MSLSSPSRIDQLFTRLKAEHRPGLVAYITAGDPSPERTPALVSALERGGADLIELGVPFSDPIADGPVIQRGSDRALKAGTTLKGVIDKYVTQLKAESPGAAARLARMREQAEVDDLGSAHQ